MKDCKGSFVGVVVLEIDQTNEYDGKKAKM